MMGGGEFKRSLLQQVMWSGGTDSKNMMSSLMPCAEEQEEASNKTMPPLSSPSLLLPPHLLQISSGLAPEVNSSTATSLARSDLHDGQDSNMPESWSQLLLGGLVGDHERYSTATALLSKGLLEEGTMPQAAGPYNFYGHGSGEEIQASGTNKSQVSQMLSASSPRSCITTSLSSNMLDFSNSTVQAPEVKNHHSDNSSEGNSAASGSGSAPKKARVHTSSSAQSTLKVRKERLGDRITALHQIVSPFGKVFSFPYLGHGNGSSMQQQHTVASLLNHSNSNVTVEAEGPTEQDEGNVGDADNKKDLRSRGLCLVPVSCTSHLAGDDNGASDFWAVAAAPPPPPPLGGIIWR
ncbi:unnamed protein product [Urochloa decumbens]|uniref:Transcription factor bHLH133 n=1 Tax=Urochloa decumbens TaxID=240449 RepID=A0ABC8ZWM1_9POAL